MKHFVRIDAQAGAQWVASIDVIGDDVIAILAHPSMMAGGGKTFVWPAERVPVMFAEFMLRAMGYIESSR